MIESRASKIVPQGHCEENTARFCSEEAHKYTDVDQAHTAQVEHHKEGHRVTPDLIRHALY